MHPCFKNLEPHVARVKCVMLGRLTRLRKCAHDDVFCVQASHFLKLQKQRKHGAVTCDVHLFGCKTKADIMSEDMRWGLEDNGTLTKLFVAFLGYVTRVDMYSTSFRIYDEAESGYQEVTLMFFEEIRSARVWRAVPERDVNNTPHTTHLRTRNMLLFVWLKS